MESDNNDKKKCLSYSNNRLQKDLYSFKSWMYINKGHSCQKKRDVMCWDCLVSDSQNHAKESHVKTANYFILFIS